MGSDLRLYQYGTEIDRILEQSEDGELTPELEFQLDAVLTSLPAKVQQVIGAIRHAEMLEERAGMERERLTRIKGVLGRRTIGLKAYLLRCMADAEVQRVVTELGTVFRRKNPRPRIRWVSTTRPLPEEFKRVKIVEEVDLEEAYIAWKRGELPEGFSVEEGGESLVVK